MDSRVVKITQRHDITRLDLREEDGYIKDKDFNKRQYINNYNAFLVDEAKQLNDIGTSFEDIDENGAIVRSKYRPCDVEMALFVA